MANNPFDRMPDLPSFELTSKTIADGEPVPQRQRSGILGAGGEDESPQLSWSGFPDGTRSFAITAYDPDAPTISGYWHWAAFNIPASVTEIDLGAANGGGMPPGAVQLRNDAGTVGFVGAGPPPGHGKHRYFFTVHAVADERLDIDPRTPCAVLGFHLFMKSIARATIVAWSETPG